MENCRKHLANSGGDTHLSACNFSCFISVWLRAVLLGIEAQGLVFGMRMNHWELPFHQLWPFFPFYEQFTTNWHQLQIAKLIHNPRYIHKLQQCGCSTVRGMLTFYTAVETAQMSCNLLFACKCLFMTTFTLSSYYVEPLALSWD